MRQRVFLPLLALALALLAACGQSVNTNEPPEIVYGQDTCDRCNMIISEERYAAAYWTAEGEARRFDDIGGMLAFITEEREEAASYWVHDFNSVKWIRAEEASYVLDGDLMTPMGFGIAAFADAEMAQMMADGREIVMVATFADLLAMNMTMPVNHAPEMEEMDHMEAGDGE